MKIWRLGSKLIEQEADLDKQFASRTVTSESRKASTAAVGRARERGARPTSNIIFRLAPF